MHWFCFSFALWLVQKTLTTLSTNQIKIKPTATWSLAFSRAFCSLLLFTLNSYWLLVIFTFVLIGCCDYFGFGCTAANQNAVKYLFGFPSSKPLLTYTSGWSISDTLQVQCLLPNRNSGEGLKPSALIIRKTPVAVPHEYYFNLITNQHDG